MLVKIMIVMMMMIIEIDETYELKINLRSWVGDLIGARISSLFFPP